MRPSLLNLGLASWLAAICAAGPLIDDTGDASALLPRAASTFNLSQLQTFPSKPRILINSDILNEPDDSMSLVRLLLYSNQFDIRGLVATTSTWLRNQTHPEAMRAIIQAYANVSENLNHHVHPDFQYPDAESLLSLVSSGPTVYGKAALAPGYPLSDGAQLIVSRLEESEEPLYIPVWSGVNTVAQALQYMQKNFSSTKASQLRSRIRLYTISDQDDTGEYIRANFPDVFYIVSVHAFNQYSEATWTGISRDFSPSVSFEKVNKTWLRNNVQIGPLGAVYPTIEYSMEGDTPSFLWLIQNGLGNPVQPEYGSWGGRYARAGLGGFSNQFVNVEDAVIGADGNLAVTSQATVWRWRDAFQNDLAAHMAWTLTSNFSAVGHPPVVKVNNQTGPGNIVLQVDYNTTVSFDASSTLDPDNPTDNSGLNFQWFQYRDVWAQQANIFVAGALTIKPVDAPSGTKTFLDSNDSGFRNVTVAQKVNVTMPLATDNLRNVDLHLVLQVTSTKAKYPLRRYQRVVFQFPGGMPSDWQFPLGLSCVNNFTRFNTSCI